MSHITGSQILQTNLGIVVNSAFFTKVFQNDLNSTPKVPLLFDPVPVRNDIVGLSLDPGGSLFSFQAGIYLMTLNQNVTSSTSNNLQSVFSFEEGGVPQGPGAYSITWQSGVIGFFGATFTWEFSADTTIEFFSEQVGIVGTMESLSGGFHVVRLSK